MKSEKKPENGLWVKAELSPAGERHPHVWATSTKEEDPGSRLAFRVSIKDTEGLETFVDYPTIKTWQAAYRANAIVDGLNGDEYPAIAKRPRRWVYIDPRSHGLVSTCPLLKDFIDGAYTDNDGRVIPRPEKGRRLKRPVGVEEGNVKKSRLT